MIKWTMTEGEFRDNFKRSRPNNFSYDGLSALYNYFNDMDEDIEFDPIAISCDFTEYTLEEIQEAYDEAPEDKTEVMDWMVGETLVLNLDNDSVIIQNF